MGLGVAALLPAAPARADHVAVIAGDDVSPPKGAAVGLLVAGRGKTVGPEKAHDALDLDCLPLCKGARCPIRIFVSLPAAEHHNVRRYAIGIVGGGYHGLLTSNRTRIPGLVSIYDVAPTVRALDRGEEPPLTSRPDSDPGAELRALDRRLAEAHDSRGPASYVVFGFGAAFALLALALRSPFLGRAALLVGPVALAAALGLSALEVARPRALGLTLAAAVGLGAPALAAAARSRRALAGALLSIFAVYVVVLVFSTETSSLAALGPHPDGGVRFYGISNQVETLLLVPALLGAALLDQRLLPPIAALVLVVVGASGLGADGGGLIVFAAGFLFLWLRLRRAPLTVRNLALAGAAVVAAGLVLVGLDAALGGSSHVTRAVSGGPLGLAGDLAHRWHVSANGFVSSTDATIIISVSLAALLWLALRRPRIATVDAVLVALAVSLLVNDTPRDVAAYGALSCAALRFWEEARRVE
ncbi:MAG TPA: hypothetical protein VGQ68_05595 [Gaiellaceae bacterium]|nr:hypothetical protein [Gaiellaceae bacterium]